MALLSTAELVLTRSPDRVVMLQARQPADLMRQMAEVATAMAQSYMPKLTGAAAANMEPIWGDGYFGIFFPDKRVWYQDHGIRSFTMNSLQGKTIPMWIDDPSGAERAKNPKAKVRTTATGRVQVLIFRRAAKKGERTTRTTVKNGRSITRNVPRSYPGAPGRISRRKGPDNAIKGVSDGGTPGQIAHANVGVRWRHPGIAPRLFLNHSLLMTAQRAGLPVVRVYACDASTMPKRYQ